ncbi:Sorbitol dehydrogenase (SDH) (Glucitol dehydrogenase) (L-iditol 2-dehydrogenase) (Polyol dehydrogenase) (Xylitol dehydrogenase) [Durusdinium trenchii]|uniref:Sorbitol dehydrogenase (SDH) (Glucitol dehydrogenase) (L-iditol 2-dehydrogenase) (Polyol dehydrogenase) (Xylitol dehydrogenase) n=1 Tax=Durusdinium trenchii TaxID=1381693 RepID=A0ABP0HQJ5_9DINO
MRDTLRELRHVLPTEICAPANCALATVVNALDMASVFCLDTQPERLKTAERFGGVPLLVTENEEDYLERSRTIREMYPRGVDVAVEMTGAKHVIHEGVQLLRNGGHYSFTGMVHPDSQLSSLTGETIIRKCLTIRGVHNYTPWNLEEAVKFLDEFREELPLESVLSPTSYKLSEINEAFAEAQTGSYCRVVASPACCQLSCDVSTV